MEKCAIRNCTNIPGSQNITERVSFHHFPQDPEMKEKWRKIVCKNRGDDNFTPSDTSIICSHHFLETDISDTKFGERKLSKNAVPIIEDVDSSMVSSPLEKVCRICLATDVKMYSLQEASIKYCMDSIYGFQDSNIHIEGLPQCVCYVCRAQLLKYYKLVEKSMIAQSTLLDIVANHGQISKDLVQQRDRKQLNLQSTLGIRLPESDIVHTCVFNDESIHDDCVLLTENKDDLHSKLGIGSPKSFADENNIEVELKGSIITSEDKDEKVGPRKRKRLVPNKPYTNTQDDDFKNSTKPKYHLKLENQDSSDNSDSEASYSDSDSEDSESDDSIELSTNKKRIKRTSKIKQIPTVYCDAGALELNIDKSDLQINLKNNQNKLNTKRVQNKNTPKRKSIVKKRDNVNKAGKSLNTKNKEVKTKHKETIKDSSCETSKETKVKRSTGAKKPDKKSREEMSIEKLKCFDIVDLSLQEQIEQWKIEIEQEVRPHWIFQCEVCSKKFPRKKAYEQHLSRHDPVRGDSVCPVCKERFLSKNRLAAHSFRVHSKRYDCKKCSKVFHVLRSAQRHEIQHSGKVYECEQCPYTTRQRSVIWLHRQQEHARGHHCAMCGRGFNNANGLAQHLTVAHPDEVVEPNESIRCEECDIAFCSEAAKRVHILTYKQHKTISPRKDPTLNTTCSVCGQTFDTVADKLDHKRTMHAKPKYNNHYKYPRTCDHCEVEVKSRREHFLHARKFHPTEKYCPETPFFICEKCGKGFQNKAQLGYHVSKHGDVPTQACPSCPRRFFDVAALRRHLSVHSALMPHVCQYCGRAFRERGNLLRHTRIHSGETPYECKQCGKKFKYWETLNQHKKHSHLKMPWPPRVRRNVKHKTKYETVHEDDSF